MRTKNDKGQLLSLCPTDDVCKAKPGNEHTSENCYARYVDLAYEGRMSDLMTYEEWATPVGGIVGLNVR